MLPEDTVSVSEDENDEVEVEMKQTKVKIKEKTMTEEIKEVLDENPLDGIVAAQGEVLAEQGGRIDELTKVAKEILDRMQDEPENRDAGYYSDVGGSGDVEAKSFGDFCLAVQRNDTTRLEKVYKAMGEATGAAGGYLVPDEFHNQLLEASADAAIIRPRATVINVASDAGKIPSLDQYTAPTAGVGNSAFAGGIVGGWAAEGSAGSSTDAAFKQIEYNIKKISAYTRVSSELVADSAMSLDGLLSRLFGLAVTSLEEMSFIRGSGVASPLGMLNAPCKIGVTADTSGAFGMDDAVEMISRFRGVGGQPIWIGHQGLITDLGAYFPGGTTGNSYQGQSAFIQPREGIPGSLLGFPLFFSEHMDQLDADDIMLIDPKAYVIFDREPVRIAFSEHARFENDEGTFRVTKRLDGQPWLTSYITLAHPTAFTVSPIVYHDD